MDAYEGEEVFTLTDEEGNESNFLPLGQKEIDGALYVALIPEEDNENGEYVILKVVEENGEEFLVTIDDDDEFEMVAEIFDNELFGEIDHDAE